jgi:hypothetical protein
VKPRLLDEDYKAKVIEKHSEKVFNGREKGK